MKRIAKLMPILIVLVLAFSVLGITAGATTNATVSTNNQLYIGDYEIDSRSGQAHIVFGITSDVNAEFGVIITDSANNSFLFKGDPSRVSSDGKFGIAIYELPEGKYFAEAYTGAGDNRVRGNKVPFTMGVDTYTVTFDTTNAEGTVDDQTVAQGGNATKPSLVPVSDDGQPFVGWVTKTGAPFDFTAPVHDNTTVYAQFEKIPEEKEPAYSGEFLSNGGGGYFGNAVAADLTGGKSLVFEVDITSGVFPNSNYTPGFFIMDHAGSGNNYPYSIGRSAGWYTNYNYFDSRHVWSGAMSKDAMIANGAVFHENLFHSEKIFRSGNSIKAIYTSYTATKGASIEIYVKKVEEDDSAYTFITSVTNIPAAAVPAENKVYLHWSLQGGVYDIRNIKPTFENYSMTIVDGNTSTDVTSLATGPNLILTNIYEKVMPNVKYEVTYDNYSGAYFNGWFGNETGATLSEGESITMQFNVEESTTSASRNVNYAFAVNGSNWTPTGNPYTVDSKAFMLYGNHVMSGQPACKAGTGASSATVNGVFNCATVFKAGNSAKAVYTYKASGSEMRIYYKATSADEWIETCSLTGISGPSSNVHISFFHDSSQWSNNKVRFLISDYTITTSDGTVCDHNGVSNNCNFEVYGLSESDHDSAVAIQGSSTTGVNAGATWLFNQSMTKADTLAFEVANGKRFEVVVDYDFAQTDVSAIVLEAKNVAHKYYKLYFDGTYVTLAGRNSTDAVWETVDKRGYQMDQFFVGLRSSSSSVYANTVFFDDVVYTVGGDKYTYKFDDTLPREFTLFADNKGASVYIPFDVFTVTYALYDGSVLETQEVGYGNNAVIPEGNWVNIEEATAKSTFIGKDTTIWLVRENENLGGNYVSVVNGTITSTVSDPWNNTFAVYAAGSSVTVTAADGEYEFAGWSDGKNIVSTSKTYTFNVSKNVKLTATYQIPKYTVTVVNGTIDGIQDTTAEIEQNTNITVMAEEKASKIFAGWSDGNAIVSTDVNYSFTVTKNITLTATYNDAYTVKFDMSEVGGVDSEVVIYETGKTVSAPDTSEIDVAPANAKLGWVDQDNKLFSFDTIIDSDVTVRAVWVDDGFLDGKSITYKSVSGESYASSIGSAIAVDLTNGDVIEMTFDILSGHTYANFQTKTSILSYLPGVNAAGYNNGWSGVEHIGLAGNPAYVAGDKYHTGYMSCTGGYSFPDVVFGTNPADPDLVMTAGKTFKAVYTAPTDTTNGSIIWYTKTIGADDSTYVESASMRNIPQSPIVADSEVFFWLDFYNCSAGGGATMEFTNFKVSVGERDLPLMFFNHYADELLTESVEHAVIFDATAVGGASSSQSVADGEFATEPALSMTAPLGGKYLWVDVNGNAFDFTKPITSSQVVYAKLMADPAVRQTTYQINYTAGTGGSASLMTSVPTDLSDGDTIYLEFDVISNSLKNWHNIGVGFMFWQGLPTHGTTNNWFSSFADCSWYGNPIHWHQGNTGSYKGSWSNGGDFTSGAPTCAGEFNPAVIMATGNTVRMAYTAPTANTDGEINIYYKKTGEDDSAYVLAASATGIKTNYIVKTSKTYVGLYMNSPSSTMTMQFTNYHVYTADSGDIPAMFDYNYMTTILTKVEA